MEANWTKLCVLRLSKMSSKIDENQIKLEGYKWLGKAEWKNLSVLKLGISNKT